MIYRGDDPWIPILDSANLAFHEPPTSSAMVLACGLDWTALLQRVFGDDVTQCPRCGDALRVLAFITEPKVTAHILEHLGLTSDPVPIAPARAPPDDPSDELDYR